MAIMSDYEPDPATAKLFARHKQAAAVIKETKKPVLAAAETAIRAGATNPELAALTGMSDETFRKLAERLGVDNRSKPPTTGPEAEARKAQALPSPTPVPLVATPLIGMSPPPPELGLSEAVRKLPGKRAAILLKPVEQAHPEWAAEQRAKFADVDSRWFFHALLQGAVSAGYAEVPGS